MLRVISEPSAALLAYGRYIMIAILAFLPNFYSCFSAICDYLFLACLGFLNFHVIGLEGILIVGPVDCWT